MSSIYANVKGILRNCLAHACNCRTIVKVDLPVLTYVQTYDMKVFKKVHIAIIIGKGKFMFLFRLNTRYDFTYFPAFLRIMHK